jgi:hypothetical protein
MQGRNYHGKPFSRILRQVLDFFGDYLGISESRSKKNSTWNQVKISCCIATFNFILSTSINQDLKSFGFLLDHAEKNKKLGYLRGFIWGT